MSGELWPLPDTWRWQKAGEIAQIVGGGTPRANDERSFEDGGTPWITPADLTDYQGVYIASVRRGLSKKGLASRGARLMPARTVLYSSRAPIGYCAIASNPIATNQGVKSLILREGLLPEFVRYYLLASKEYAESLASGTTFKELSGSRIADMLIPIPPPEDQRRIVAELDTLVGHSKTVRERTSPHAVVERYKKAILTVAFRGELTADWRRRRSRNIRAAAPVPLEEALFQIKTGPFGSTLHKSDYVSGGVPVVNSMHINRRKLLHPEILQ